MNKHWISLTLLLVTAMALFAGYVVAYFSLGERYPVYEPKFIGESITIVVPDPDVPPETGRMFAHQWAVILFYPAACIEEAITGRRVDLQVRPD